MKRVIILTLLVFVGVFAWRLGERISADAISMAIGIVLGVLASVPAALLMLAAHRRSGQTKPDSPHSANPYYSERMMGTAGQPPIIVVAPPMMTASPGGAWGQEGQGPWALPYAQEPVPTAPHRQFRVVGEDDSWLDR